MHQDDSLPRDIANIRNKKVKMETEITIHDDLRNTIKEMQHGNCEGAKAQVAYLEKLMRELLRCRCITPEDDSDRLKMLEKLSYIQMILESFIPQEQ